MSSRKNLGKVKRYNRSFYSGHRHTKQIIGIVLLLAAVFLVGWLIGPMVIDFGTSTWYKITRGEANSSVSTPDTTSTPEQEPTPAPDPTPEPTQAPGSVIEQGEWAFLSVSALQGDKLAATVADLSARGVRYAVLPLKDNQGYVYYQSQIETATAAISATYYDPSAAALACKQAGITPVGSICAFQDPIAPRQNRAAAVAYGDTEYLWLDAAVDAGGKPWLNPYSPEANAYIRSLIVEATDMGVQQILLSGVMYPPTAGRQMANFNNELSSASMHYQLTLNLAEWQTLATCWVEYSLDLVVQGAENQRTFATPATLGVQNLLVRMPSEQTEETAAQLAAASADALANGVANVASVQGDSVTLHQ